jgi:aspartate 1-decarboxylase
MLRAMLTSRIHRATVTAARDDDGSVRLDADLMAAAGLLPGERVSVVGVTTGVRLAAYVSAGERGSGELAVADPSVHRGDLVDLLAYGVLDTTEATTYRPRLVFLDEHNRIVEPGHPDVDLPAAETDAAAALDALLQAES